MIRKNKIAYSSILKRGKKYLFLAYDQGLEHGPNDLENYSLDPNYLVYIANNSKIDAFVCHKGIAEKYSNKLKKPLIVKVNGKNNLNKDIEPYSPIVCSVEYAKKTLRARGIGFTYFDGSSYGHDIEKDLKKIQEETRKYNLPFIVWMYPRGSLINDMDGKTLAYSARIGLELGADFIKMKYNGNLDDLKYMKSSCGKVKLLLQGGRKFAFEEDFLDYIRETKNYCDGYAIGRNIFNSENPIELIKKIRKILNEK